MNNSTKIVNFLQFIPNKTRVLLLQASYDNTITLWSLDAETEVFCYKNWKISQSLLFNSPIQHISLVQTSEDSYILACLFQNCTLEMLELRLLEKELKLEKLNVHLQFPTSKFMESSALHAFSDKNLILALGSVDKCIYLYSFSLSGERKLAYVCTLKGHENAITDLKFKVHQKGSTLFLATASRDQYIRLWTFSN